MGAPITFRPARPEDGPQLLSLHRRAILGEAARTCPLDAALSWACGLTARGYAGAMARGEHIEIAAIDGRIVGFCAVRGEEITGLYVDPELTRRGVGARLAGRALQRIGAAGHARARVASALGAEPFYAAMGFRKTGERLEATRGGLAIPVVEMEQPLTLARSARLWSVGWSQARAADARTGAAV
jgi:GNAT superfamily N-acetyltransferase